MEAQGEWFPPNSVAVAQDTDWRDLQDWRNQAEKDFKPATINRLVSSLKTFFAFALEPRNDPTQRLKGIEQQTLSPKALTDDEVKRILRQVRKDNLHDWAILELLAATGLRVSEVATLTRANLTLSAKAAGGVRSPVFIPTEKADDAVCHLGHGQKYAAEAGVEHVSPHSFRHTVATRLVRNPKVDLVTVATFLGHSRLDTTARYSQPNDDDLKKAAEAL